MNPYAYLSINQEIYQMLPPNYMTFVDKTKLMQKIISSHDRMPKSDVSEGGGAREGGVGGNM